MSKKTERKPVSSENFKSRVADVVRSGKSIRGNIQELVMFAIVFYLDPENNGNTANLTYLYDKVAGVKSLNHRQLGIFVEDTVNVKLGKTSDGDAVFKKAVKGDAPSLRDGADLTVNWWEYGRVTAPKALDIFKQLETLRKGIAAATGDEAKKPLVEGQELIADAASGMLTDMITQLQASLTLKTAEAEAAAAAEESVSTEVPADFVGPTLVAA